jgi:diadenosine tetraphosphatase ApaH/serine/threonine PP2A family protein phosphatase
LKLAIISDIHANLTALKSCLQVIENKGVDDIYFLGDLVGYGAQPNECCDLLRKTTDKAVIGNHDAAACGLMDFSWFNPVAKRSLEWTSDTLTEDNRNYIKNLPYSLNLDDIIFSHAMIHKMEDFYYDDELIPIYYSFHEMNNKYTCSFIGHSHKYNQLKAENTNNRLSKWGMPEEILIEDKFKYIINAGSVGQPRDKNPDACFLIYDDSNKKRKVTVHRVKYDIAEAARLIIESELPTILAERLFLGI